MSETTRDTIFAGRLTLRQPARGAGYRLNVDAILLASFAGGRRHAQSAFDVGAGVGGVGLSLLHLDAAEHVTMIEHDTHLAELASDNADANGWADRVAVIAGDALAASIVHAGKADLVVCNPPYVEPGRGRPPHASKAAARSGHLDLFLDAARHLAGRRARVCFVYPAREATTFLVECRHRGLEPKRLRAVHAKPTLPARTILVECAAGRPGGLFVEPPLLEMDAKGKPSDELMGLLHA